MASVRKSRPYFSRLNVLFMDHNKIKQALCFKLQHGFKKLSFVDFCKCGSMQLTIRLRRLTTITCSELSKAEVWCCSVATRLWRSSNSNKTLP